MTDAQTLQRLVYMETEVFEKQSEAEKEGPFPSNEDMVIRFIEHLVKVTTRRSSFYVNLGLGLLLHRYNTAETMAMYRQVIQDPSREKSDDYYRSRKKKLMTECTKRFDSQLEQVRAARGERVFRALDEPGQLGDVAMEALCHFVPWENGMPVVGDGQGR